MIIAVDATTLGSGSGGDETLMLSVLRGLAAVLAEADTVLALADTDAALPGDLTRHPRLRFERARRAGGLRHYAYTLPNWLNGLGPRGCRPDVVVSLTHAPVRSPAPVALIVTDLSFRHVPDAYPRSTRWRLNGLVPWQAPRAATVLTISDFCRADLVQSYAVDPGRVHVFPLTIDAPGPVRPAARADLAARGVRRPYLLYLGNLHPRKNVPAAIEAFRAARAEVPELGRHQFVIAGRTWFGSDGERRAAAGADPGSVLFLDRVSHDEREVLLHDASALVYLSTFEGFGLPPLEAMARGTAVLASDVTAIPEVCGDAALLVDPTDHAAVRAGVRDVLADRPLRQRLVERGRLRADSFDAVATGDALLRALAPATG